MPLHRDSYCILRETLRWRVALVLSVLVMVQMLALGLLNTHLGYADTALLSWIVLALTGVCVLDAGTPLFRYGGEEFAVILNGASEAEGCALGERLRSAIAAFDLQGITVTISTGVATWQAGHDNLDSALGRADRALYTAKRSGRNRVIADSSASP